MATKPMTRPAGRKVATPPKQPEPVRCVCGKSAQVYGWKGHWFVGCNRVGCWSSAWCLTRRAAILAWNAVMIRKEGR